MAADGQILHKAFDAYPGLFHELNVLDFPITTLASANGFVEKPQKFYTMTYHTNPAVGTSNNKPDNASPTYGSTAHTNGSNVMQIIFEGANETWAARGDQDLGRTGGWQDQRNQSFQSQVSNLDRAKADAVLRIKGQLEYQALYGAYNNPSEGTTGAYSQRGLTNDPDLLTGTAAGGVIAAGTLGTLGTLDRDTVWAHLSAHHGQKLWGSEPLIACGGAQSIIALNNMFMDEFNMGKNGESINVSGINLTAFETPLGPVFLKLTRDPAKTSDLWFLNPNYMEMVARPVPGMGVMFEKDTTTPDKAQDAFGIYTEAGFNYSTGLAHSLIKGVGTAIVGGQNTV